MVGLQIHQKESGIFVAGKNLSHDAILGSLLKMPAIILSRDEDFEF